MKPFARLRNFMQTASSLEDAVLEIANALSGCDVSGTVQVRVLDNGEDSYLGVSFSGEKATPIVKATENPSLELVMKRETAHKVFAGSLSPLQAFKDGKMRIRGDAKLGRRLLRHLADSKDAQFDICLTGV